MKRFFLGVMGCLFLGIGGVQFAPMASAQDQVDLTKLPENAVTIYTQGNTTFSEEDIVPLSSGSSGYTQKWEFYIYTKPYKTRIKFEISNFAFSKNDAKIRGYVQEVDDNGETLKEYKLSKTLKNGEWSKSKDGLGLEFGDYTLSYKAGVFHITGSFEKGTFEYDIAEHPWKPGTGNAYFGNTSDNVFKYSIMTYHQPVMNSVFHVDGKNVPVTGLAYGNHYATTVAVYDMFDEISDFRKLTDDLLVEFRYFVPSEKYNAQPFGFMFVAYQGQPILGAPSIERTPLETWYDDDNYHYEIDARQRIVAHEDNNTATFTVLTADPQASDPYADLPAFQRNVASRFSKPIEYNIKMDWELLLNVDGYQAKIPFPGSYSLTRLR